MRRELFLSNWLLYLSLGYLLLPFTIFCLTFLRLWIGLPIVIILVWIVIRIWKQKDASQISFRVGKSDLIIGLVVLGVWVLLSGIGGFAFQNTDFHYRNAIFNDLIKYDLPVYYIKSSGLPTTTTYALTYYVGYWLPAALVGKILGLQSANVLLFFWTWFGVFLTSGLLKERIKSTLFACSLLLIFFSGMDVLGTLFRQIAQPNSYPTITPTITHLEWWSEFFQFSSFTTQLFWVFNQAIPAWICTALILNNPNRKYIFLIWALCFFFSPIPAVGLLPFIFLVIQQKGSNVKDIFSASQGLRVVTILKNVWNDVRVIISPENLAGGGLVFIISLSYFYANTSASTVQFIMMNYIMVLIFIFFLIIEVAPIWLLFIHEKYRNPWWYVTGGMFVISGLIRVGTSLDFCMRASIPALFILMSWSGEGLFKKPVVKYHRVLILLLVLGAFTPIYEINRSIYRTVNYYIRETSQSAPNPFSQGIEKPNPFPELDHPSTLTADLYPSLAIFNPDELSVFVGKTKSSFFFQYLAQPP